MSINRHTVIVLEWTTEKQIDLLRNMIAQEYARINYLLAPAYEKDGDLGELEDLWYMLQNIAADLEIEGFEMS